MALITQEGLNNLRTTLDNLYKEEQEAIESMKVARGYGDFSENAELDAARDWLERVQNKISQIQEIIRESSVFDANQANKEIVGFGCLVRIQDENDKIFDYKIVGSSESNLSENKISINSLLAKYLIGKKIGDTFNFPAPAGEKTFEILLINY